MSFEEQYIEVKDEDSAQSVIFVSKKDAAPVFENLQEIT